MTLDADLHVVTLDEGVEPFTLRPVIADLLRTRYPIPGSIFLVEGVDWLRVGRSGSWEAVRLLLGDGELCVQALLDDKMHRFVRPGLIDVGSYVRVQSFELRWVTQKVKAEGDIVKGKGKRAEARSGERMVYLAVRDLMRIGRNDFLGQLHLAGIANANGDASTDDQAGSQVDGTPAAKELQVLEPRAVDRPAPATHKVPDGNREAAPRTSPGKRKQDAFDYGSDADLEAAFDAIEAQMYPQGKHTLSRSRPPTTSYTSAAQPPTPLPGDWNRQLLGRHEQLLRRHDSYAGMTFDSSRLVSFSLLVHFNSANSLPCTLIPVRIGNGEALTDPPTCYSTDAVVESNPASRWLFITTRRGWRCRLVF